MKKTGIKTRDVRFYSEKNQKMMLVHTKEERAYAKKLEVDEHVKKYAYGKELDSEVILLIPRTDIRGSYLSENWVSDFFITYNDETLAVREIAKEHDLSKLSEVEKLELSRRYWKQMKISDWKVVLM